MTPAAGNEEGLTPMTGNGPGNRRWVGAAAAAVAMGCGPLVLAAPAAAENYDKHLAVDCPRRSARPARPDKAYR